MLWGMTLLYFQPVLGRHNIRPPHFASKVSYSASPQSFAKCPHITPFSCAAPAMLFGKNRAEIFLNFERPTLQGPYLHLHLINNLSIKHVDHSVGIIGIMQGVGHHHDGCALLV